MEKKGYRDVRALVAFSRTVTDPDTHVEYREPLLNGFGEKELPQRFASDEYQVLVVAEKYQTGFDQPLLHTMYVDLRVEANEAPRALTAGTRWSPLPSQDRGARRVFRRRWPVRSR